MLLSLRSRTRLALQLANNIFQINPCLFDFCNYNYFRKMETVKLTMNRLLRDTDVMADVLGFLPRREIALRLANVNVAFSALCNCWCQPGASSVLRRPILIRHRCWSCMAIHCVHVVQHLWASNLVLFHSKSTIYFCNTNTGFEVQPHTGRSGDWVPTCFVLSVLLFISVIRLSHFYLIVLVQQF